VTTFNFVTDCGAPTNGTSDASPAVDYWLANAADGDTLFMPAYSYNFASTITLTAGLKNITVNGTGAIVSNLYIGHQNLLIQDYVHSARIQTVAATATSATLVTGAQISRFSVGQYIMIAGLGLQTPNSFPPNFQYVEFRQITGIAGSTITWIEPLRFAYKSTWPLVDPGVTASYDMGGPATAYALSENFDCQQTYRGLTVTGSPGVGISCAAGRSLILDGMTFTSNNGPSISFGKTISVRNSAVGAQNEIDKCIETAEYINCTGAQLYMASACPGVLTVKNNCRIDAINGTGYDTFIRDTCSIGLMFIGSAGFGRSNRLIVDDTVTIAVSGSGLNTGTAKHVTALSSMTFSGGVFTIANAGDLYNNLRLFVPGFKYAVGYDSGDGSINIVDNLGAITYFTVTDMTQDASNTYIATDLVAIPGGTYVGHAANAIYAYGVKSLQPSSSFMASLTAAVEPGGAVPAVTVSNINKSRHYPHHGGH
jgi:hypothetical protein